GAAALVHAAEAGVAVLGLPGPDLLRTGGGAVRPAGLEEPGDHLRMALGVGALEDRALVPVDPQPLQRLEDPADVLRGGALAVGVLDAQDEAAAPAPGEEPVVQ